MRRCRRPCRRRRGSPGRPADRDPSSRRASPYSTKLSGSSSWSIRSRTGGLAEVALPGDAVGTAHRVGLLVAGAQTLDERLPVVQFRLVGHQRPFHCGVALLGEGGDALRPRPRCSEVIVSIEWRRLSASAADASHTRVERVAPELDDRRRLRRERRRQFVGGGVEFGRGNDPVHEADALGFGGVDAAAGQHQLERLLRRHRAHERHRDHVRPQADVDLRRAELRVVGGDHEVARQREAEATGQRVAAHPRDDRLAERPHVVEEPGQLAPALVQLEVARARRHAR